MSDGEKNSSAAAAAPIDQGQAAGAATPDVLKVVTNGWHALNYALMYVPEGDILRPKMLKNLQALTAARDAGCADPVRAELLKALEVAQKFIIDLALVPPPQINAAITAAHAAGIRAEGE